MVVSGSVRRRVRALRVAEVGGRSISAYLTLRQVGELIFGRENDRGCYGLHFHGGDGEMSELQAGD